MGKTEIRSSSSRRLAAIGTSRRRVRLGSALAGALGACLVLASSIAMAVAPAHPQISVSIPGEVQSGGRTTATGRVTSFDRRGRVQLQSQQPEGWKPLSGGALRHGRFRISFVLGAGIEAANLRAVLLVGDRRVATSAVRRIRIAGAALPPSSVPPTPVPPSPSAVESTQPSGPPEPPPSPSAAYWGAWIGPQFTGTPAPEDMGAVADFEKLSKKPLSLLETFAGWATCTGPTCQPNQPFPLPQLEAMRDYGAIPLYSWASEGNAEPDDQPEFQLADIIAGNFDSYIRGWAEEAKAWGHPFFLRFDWEMNGNWFPWSESRDGNHPGEFVTAWRHVHDIFTQVGATNVSWVWCPYVNPNGNLQSPATLYPGDAYVDWTCLDGYNKGTTSSPTAQYRSFDYLFGPDYREITETIAPSKPMILAEVASSEHGGSKAEWISDMFDELPGAYPKVRGLMWFDYVDQGNDWPIETSVPATEAFAAGIGDPRYLPNSFAASAGGPVPVP
jgi:mannan endo-1,4-beta-mannosidase